MPEDFDNFLNELQELPDMPVSDENDFPSPFGSPKDEPKDITRVEPVHDAFLKDLNTMSEVFALRRKISQAQDMLIELREQRDAARDLRDDALATCNKLSRNFVLATDEFYEWNQLGAWNKFWSAGAVLVRVAELLNGAL